MGEKLFEITTFIYLLVIGFLVVDSKDYLVYSLVNLTLPLDEVEI